MQRITPADAAAAERPNAPITPGSLWLFRFVFTAALAVSGVAVVFFVWGVIDGSVSSFNMNLWLMTLVLVTAIPLSGWHLRSRGRARPAILVLSVLAVPGLLYALFILLIVITQPRWN